MVLIAVEVSPVGSKPPVAVGERISKGERHDLGAAAPLPTRASSLLEGGRAGGPVESPPKLVEHMGSGPTVCRTEMPMHRLYCFSSAFCALGSLGVCLPVCFHGKTWLPSVLLQAG